IHKRIGIFFVIMEYSFKHTPTRNSLARYDFSRCGLGWRLRKFSGPDLINLILAVSSDFTHSESRVVHEPTLSHVVPETRGFEVARQPHESQCHEKLMQIF